MKQSIINDLLYGRFNPYEELSALTPEDRKLLRAVIEKQEQFVKLLEPDQRKMLNTLMEEKTVLSCNYERKALIYGFCLGARIIMEIYDGTGAHPACD